MAHRLLAVCCLFSLFLFVPHIVRPVSTSGVYVSLTGALVAVNVISLWLVAKRPGIALQSYWWSALVVIAVMVVVDVRGGASNLPMIVAIPPLATVAIRWLVSLRAAWVYALGTLALLVPSGIVYDDLGRAGGLVAVVVLAVTIGSGITKDLQTTSEPALTDEDIDALCVLRDELKRIDANDAATTDRNR